MGYARRAVLFVNNYKSDEILLIDQRVRTKSIAYDLLGGKQMNDKENTVIQSFSAPADLIAKLDELQKKNGYSSRSEVVRKGLRHFFSLIDERIEGEHPEGVIVTFHPRKANAAVSDIRHKYADILTGYTHSHTESMLCSDVMLISGPNLRVRSLINELRATRDVSLVQFVPSPK